MTMIMTFFAAFRAGDTWARYAAVGMIIAASLGFASYQLWRLYDAGGDARQAKIERAIANDTIKAFKDRQGVNHEVQNSNSYDLCISLGGMSGNGPSGCEQLRGVGTTTKGQ